MGSRVAVEEIFPDEVLSSDDPKLLRSCICALWKREKRMDGHVLRWGGRNRLQVCYRIAGPLYNSGPAVSGRRVYVNYIHHHRCLSIIVWFYIRHLGSKR